MAVGLEDDERDSRQVQSTTGKAGEIQQCVETAHAGAVLARYEKNLQESVENCRFHAAIIFLNPIQQSLRIAR
jgi:hypothetical protein